MPFSNGSRFRSLDAAVVAVILILLGMIVGPALVDRSQPLDVSADPGLAAETNSGQLATMKVQPPRSILLVGQEVALLWQDGREDILPMEFLRAHSPSAENMGEADLFGRVHGADPRTEHPGVRVEGYEPVGNYGLRLIFSDGHQSGIFGFDYLQGLADNFGSNSKPD